MTKYHTVLDAKGAHARRLLTMFHAPEYANSDPISFITWLLQIEVQNFQMSAPGEESYGADSRWIEAEWSTDKPFDESIPPEQRVKHCWVVLIGDPELHEELEPRVVLVEARQQ